ncbi:hypothetical protein ACFHYQ_26305 [Sphaerimonospora cavernae]|uniref:Uncharacterized protein n=1 Tax=Sphaerimonospora cavernae TaxID=1740611 RepID=A0ABV6UC99_9ACTN
MLDESVAEPADSPSIAVDFPTCAESVLHCDRDHPGHVPKGPLFGLGWDRWNHVRRGLPGRESEKVTDLVVTDEGTVSFAVSGENARTVTGWNHTPQRLREHCRGSAKLRWHDSLRLLEIGTLRFHIATGGPSPCTARHT